MVLGSGRHTWRPLGSIFPKSELIWNLTEPDLTRTEVRWSLSAAFGRIGPTAIAFKFARNNNIPTDFEFANLQGKGEPNMNI